MKTFSVIIKEEDDLLLRAHLIRADKQEDLCFATYRTSTGANRTTAIISCVILPEDGERNIHGNVSFLPSYLERALQIAHDQNEGLALMHSHLNNGWQDMSPDDMIAEHRIAPAVFGACSLPLIGLTIGKDGAWSARYWLKDAVERRKYHRHWCETVRVLGKKLSITFNDQLIPPSFDAGSQLRTISAWGQTTQEDLSRLRVGIVGLGSVGSIVAEILARTGIAHFTLIDFDAVEEKNLDRLTNIYRSDIGRAKVSAIADAIRRSATAPATIVRTSEFSICEEIGFKQSLDCDVLFSCVDRPWPRQVLNFIAYAHLIPVIDGGILVRTNRFNTNIAGADWKAQTVGHQRPCLECLGQYQAEHAALEMDGKLDDPAYITGIDPSRFLDAHENVFCFSNHLASMEVLQLLNLVLAPAGMADVGQQMHHFVIGTLDVDRTKTCHPSCFFQSIDGKGDSVGITVYTDHKVAEQKRQERKYLAPSEPPADNLCTTTLNLWRMMFHGFRKLKTLGITVHGNHKVAEQKQQE